MPMSLADACLPLQRENLYVEVLYTVKHKVGATTSQHSSLVDELNDYTQEAFHFSREQHQRMMTIASDEKVSVWSVMRRKWRATGGEVRT